MKFSIILLFALFLCLFGLVLGNKHYQGKEDEALEKHCSELIDTIDSDYEAYTGNKGEKLKDMLDRSNWVKLDKKTSTKATKDDPLNFRNIDFEIDPKCKIKENYYYRTYDGSCNWLKKGESDAGAINQPFGRDVEPAHYAPGTDNTPRQGPNPRELSNIFFKNRKTKFWDHTPWLPAFVEFLVHDLMMSSPGQDKGDVYNIPIPKGDPFFDPNSTGDKSLPFWRSQKVEGTGVDGKQREIVNGRNNWMDLETIYGGNVEDNRKLRLKDDDGTVMCELILDDDGYLPQNDERFNFNMTGYPDQQNLFACGDQRCNQDFVLMVMQTLFAREHNRMCGVLKTRYPDWADEERYFLTSRTVLSGKMNMVGGAYFLAYFVDVPPPVSPLSIYRSWYGESVLKVNPLIKYPWADLLKDGKPLVLPNEFSVEYRWHDLIMQKIELYNEKWEQYAEVDVPKTAFNASAFKKAGFENVLRGMCRTQIPDFRSGVQDGYRDMWINFRDPRDGFGFDLAAWQIEHERERGLPTFNEYIRKHYDGVVPMKPRKTFEEFTSNTYFQQELKRLYKTPDDVDMSVGQEIDEEWWPGLHIPKSMLIFNFFTLFKASVTDRFALNYNFFWCISEHKPWNCVVNNVMQELLWKPKPSKLFPNARLPDAFWWKEMDARDQGKNMLHKMIVQNTNVKCLQKDVFFVPDEKTNPIICYELSNVPGPKNSWFRKIFRGNNQDRLFKDATSAQPYLDLNREFGDVVHFETKKHGDTLLVADLHEAQRLLRSPADSDRPAEDYVDYTYGRLQGHKDGTPGFGLSNANGKLWGTLRGLVDQKLAQPGHVAALVPLFDRQARALVDRLLSSQGRPVTCLDDVRHAVYWTACVGTFGQSACERGQHALFRALDAWQEMYPKLATKKAPYRSLLVLAKRKKLDGFLDSAGDFVRALYDQKRQAGRLEGDDWLTHLMRAGGDQLTKEQTVVAALDLFFSASKSGPFALQSGFVLLAKNPDVVERAFNELDQVLRGERVTVASLHKLKYTFAVVREILRLQPAAGALLGRRSTRTQTVAEWQAPQGTRLLANVLSIHRDRRFFSQPLEFRPERFLEPQEDLSFGAGARGCPAKDLALAQQTVFWVNLLSRISQFVLVSPAEPVVRYGLSSYFEQSLKFEFHARDVPDSSFGDRSDIL